MSDLGPAQNYYKNLLTAGRTQTAAQAAPAVNSELAQSDARRNAEGAFGTGRSGGTAGVDRAAGEESQSKIDNIINETLMGGRQEGARGLERVSGETAQIGSTELSNSMRMLGLSSDAVNNILSNSTQSRVISNKINLQTQEQWGQLIGGLMMAAGG